MYMMRRLAVVTAILVLQGCAAPVKEADAWPAQLPARQHFQHVYAADASNAAVQTEAQYLAWVRRFYEGSEFYAWGFLDLESLVQDGRDGEAALILKQKLDAVGMQIGADWAKDRGEKSITTRMLVVWAAAIQSAVMTPGLESVVDQVSADVAAVLSGELDAAKISADRYAGTLALASADSCGDPSALDAGCWGD